jgi:hydroxymethylpyrimidine/phosphomethylpyrimidine kinase
LIPNVLTIAGSDSGGGAGVQADLKTFSALGAYGASVITALTAQNTRTVSAIHDLPPEFVTAQMDAVFGDIAFAAVKIGMLSRPAIIDAVAIGLRRHRARNIVLDPVMVAKSGDRLLGADAVAALRQRLLPLATVITPNLPEAAVLLDLEEAEDEAGMIDAAARLRALGPQAVLLKGEHPRHRLHPLICDCRAARARAAAAPCGACGQGLRDRRDPGRRSPEGRPRPRAGAPFPCAVAGGGR